MNQFPRLVVITGGTGGLGRALAREYLARGDRVILTGRDTRRLVETCRELTAYGQVDGHPLDVLDDEAVAAFAASVKSRFERCDVLLNNAGTAVFRPFVQLTAEEVRQIWEVNAAGVFRVTHAFLPMMLEAKSGQVVNIASLAGRVATAKAAVYAASKAAVIRFSEGLRQELTGTGISVTCILPGPLDTPFLDLADESGSYRERVRRHLLEPAQAARLIVRAADERRPEYALPTRLHLMSMAYVLLPEQLKEWLAPLINRK